MSIVQTSPSASSGALGRTLFGFLSGLVFGLGLVVSGMSDPAKVLNFLDIAAIWTSDAAGWRGTWDPSLAFVMGGASLVAFVGYRLAWRRPAPVLMHRFDVPSSTAIDRPLLTGSVLFGIGWGIGGFCPGPAWTALPLLAPGTLVFVPAMIAGLWMGSRFKSSTLFAGAPA